MDEAMTPRIEPGPVRVAAWVDVPDRMPTGAQVEGVDLVIVRRGEAHSVLYGLRASVEMMQVLARACGHRRLSDFSLDDLTTFDRDIAHLTGVAYGGMVPR